MPLGNFFRGRSAIFLMALAVVGPPLLAFNLLPSSTFFNQALAFLGWGTVLVGLGSRARIRIKLDAPSAALITALVLLALFVLIASVWQALPFSLALPAWVMLGAAAITFIAGRSVVALAGTVDSSRDVATRFVSAYFAALAWAGLLSALIAAVQYLLPSTTDHWWVVRRIYSFRAAGNLRQPNLLASQLIWAIAAAVVLVQWQRLSSRMGSLLGAACLLGVAMTGSRIGMVQVAVLAGWGAVDRHLSIANRRRLLVAPLVFAAFWLLLVIGSDASGLGFGGVVQMSKADPTSSRLGVWRQTMQLIAEAPWLGVGWGSFNFAWTLTPMVRYSAYTFTHTHNLLLQWAVELGLPATLLLVLLVGFAFRAAWRRTRAASGTSAVARSAALLIVFSMLLHSMTEFPLWYAYFLLPMMFAFGIVLAPWPGVIAEPASTPWQSTATTAVALRASGWAMCLSAALAVQDYQRVAEIYLPHAGSGSDDERIAHGRHSILYGHVADRFAGIITRPNERSLEPFKRATREMLDMRLLIAWALALHEAGDTDRARYIAQRVREFDDSVARQFFEPCASATVRPFQCDVPSGHYTFASFR